MTFILWMLLCLRVYIYYRWIFLTGAFQEMVRDGFCAENLSPPGPPTMGL